MRKLLLVACALICVPPLGACATLSTLPTSPAAVANTTVLDEQAVTTPHLAYKLWRTAVETGVNAGIIKGPTATRVAALDNQLYSALNAVDAAYSAGNSADYSAALVQFNAALAVGYAAIGGK